MCAEGFGPGKHAVKPVTPEVLLAMFECGALSMKDPVALITLVWWHLNTLCGLRCIQECWQVIIILYFILALGIT